MLLTYFLVFVYSLSLSLSRDLERSLCLCDISDEKVNKLKLCRMSGRNIALTLTGYWHLSEGNGERERE